MNKRPFVGVLTLLVLLIIAYAFAKFEGGFVSWFIFYALLPIVLIQILHYFFVFKGLTVTRELDKNSCTAGDDITIKLTIKNPYRIPYVFLRLRDMWPEAMQDRADQNEHIVYPWFKKELHLSTQFQQVKRGVFHWDVIVVRTGDLFGFLKKDHTFHQPAQLVVYPHYQDLHVWPSYNERNAGTAYTLSRHQAEDITSVMGARDYLPGDRMGIIHWKASARTGKLKTKEFEHQFTNDFMFFLDQTHNGYDDVEEQFERAVSLTASLARFCLRSHFSCGLVSYGKYKTVLPMNRQAQHMDTIFDHLARVQPDADMPFLQAVLREMVDLPNGTTAVLITPTVTQEMVHLALQLKHKNIKVEFFGMQSKQEWTAEQKNVVSMFHQQHINFYTVADDNFDQLLRGGGQHESA